MPLQNFTGLDFDQIKTTLRDYLKNNSNFTDYDFEGSNLATILDVLAYNTYTSSYNANMISNEVFIDSATLRENVVALARNIGYLPRSKKASRSLVTFFVDMTTVSPTPASLTLKKGPVASTGNQFGGQSYAFGIPDDKTVGVIEVSDSTGSGRVAQFNDVEIYEGTLLDQTFTYSSNNPFQKFILPNTGIDLDTLSVKVKSNSNSSTAVEYVRQDSLFTAKTGTTINGESNIYFINEVESEQYELIFGDGIFGKALQDGNVVEASYIVTSGDSANGISNLTFAGRLTYTRNSIDYNVTSGISLINTQGRSSGGEAIESVESVKKYAPQIYATQNRALTANDYEILIPNKIYPEAESISVYGGEEMVPPQYGRVFISIKPRTGDFVPGAIKENIKRDLKKYSVAGIVPEILDLKYLFVETNNVVYYNTTKAPSAAFVSTVVQDNINKYAESAELNKYGARFKYSQFLRVIDQSHEAVTSTITTVEMRRDLRLAIDTFAEYAIDFGNEFHIDSMNGYNIRSSSFRVLDINEDVYLYDMPNTDKKTGTMNLFSLDSSGSNTPTVQRKNVGKVNYKTGRITLDPINIVSAKTKDGVQIMEISTVPESNDVIGLQDLYLQLDSSNVDMVVDEISSGIDPSGSNYVVTPSYTTGSIVR
jgi:hypothetical protein|tara:strand:- start:2519 stop:4477 length:1959 start_codon:yes stop_codon:yes gene_type:complete